ncbi:putative SH3 domain protein (Cyk3) [Aspergillus stella-maris]|uniref:putative SH3 domain protein (Cyk3) n=1 Tax=Aspergillus stella-maris TaxID=1810926 RepID=UPI003CCE120F
MAPSTPQLPTKFPCWCRAIYSWGGETKRDLGFIEGDLIECLNAGDGQWWMGRLRRDRRMMGLFPSNFVQLLGEDFVPVTRSISPMVPAAASPITNPTSAPKKQKTVWRKPFQAHKQALAPSGESSSSASPVGSTIPQTPPRDGSLSRRTRPSRTPTTAVKQQSSLSRPLSVSRPSSRGASPRSSQEPVAQQYDLSSRSRTGPPSRAVSPRPPPRETANRSPLISPTAPMHNHVQLSHSPSRAISPRPQLPEIAHHSPLTPSVPVYSHAQLSHSSSRAISPRPHLPEVANHSPLSPSVPTRHGYHLSHQSSREISPLLLTEREESPPPPPPPPHRVAVQRQPSPHAGIPQQLDMNDRYVVFARTPSPAAHSEANSEANGHTPSPLRDAMEDVMTSLDDMGISRGSHSPSPQPDFNNPWSPSAFDSLHNSRQTQSSNRPLTSLGFEGEKDYYNSDSVHRNSVYTHDPFIEGPPQINNYVQRMESRLRQMQEQGRRASEDIRPQTSYEMDEDADEMPPPPPPRHTSSYHSRHNSIPTHLPSLKNRRSGNDLRNDMLNRTFTNKSNTTNSSSGIQSNSTNPSLMSDVSAGGFSATSAGSYARRGNRTADRPNTSFDTSRARGFSELARTSRPESPMSGISYHSSHNTSRQGASSAVPWSSLATTPEESNSVFGGLATPKAKKQGFFKKILESAKTGAANARSSIAVGQNGGPYSPTKGRAISPIHSSQSYRESAAREIGLSNSPIDWVQVRRDVNRASSPSRNERVERAERCQMMDHPVIYAVEELHETAEGEESIDGLPVGEPMDFSTANLTLVDKSARFVNSLPPMTNPMSLAQGYVCRPYKSDVQRLRAIFTWVSEKIAWDEPIEEVDIDLRRVLQTKRGCPQEVAYLVREMCAAVGLHSEAIEGFLKTPGEMFELDSLSRPNHWWNAVLVDGEWRLMDCSLASPTNPRRNQFVTINVATAEPWYFLARPLEFCYSHVPLEPEAQHICPPISPDVLLALPTTCPTYFKMGIEFPDYDTSLFRLEGLELLQVRILVPADVECAAEVEAPGYARDADGDFFESGEIVRKRALVQPEWVKGQKRITIKAVLPGDEGQGVVKIYAGRKGLMHSSRDIPHPLAFALPILHAGENPPYDFVIRHPTPHAHRHDLYIMQPQCHKLAVNNTFVFAVRQHPSSATPQPASTENSFSGRVSPSVFSRPASALSMVSSSAGGSTVSTVSNEFSASTSAISSTRSNSGREKPAKLAIQSPSGKILRLTRKADHMISSPSSSDSPSDCTADGSVWETVIKIGERGVWRGLVLADRVARCVIQLYLGIKLPSLPFRAIYLHIYIDIYIVIDFWEMTRKIPLPDPFASIPRVNLLYPFSSPIHALPGLTSAAATRTLGAAPGQGKSKVNVSLFAKREDHSSPLACAGNKYRKLEYIVPDILSSSPKYGAGVAADEPVDVPEKGKVTTLVTEGAIQSNHTVQVASVASKIGLDSVVILHKGTGGGLSTTKDKESFLRTGNPHICRLLGSDVRVSEQPTEPKTQNDLVEEVFQELKGKGEVPYWIPSGASLHPLGSIGYARCAFEIAEQEKELLPSTSSPADRVAQFDYIFIACGSGSTLGGLIAGFKLLDKTQRQSNSGLRPRRIIGILTSRTRRKNYHAERILRFARRAAGQIGLDPETDITMDDVYLDDRFAGERYGVLDAKTKETLGYVAEKEEVILDPVYTAKVARGMLEWVGSGEVERDFLDRDAAQGQGHDVNVLFVHTGGQSALGAYADI